MRYTIGMIGEDDIRRVREATDIVELIGERVVLKQRGREFWGNCPFHNEKTPSFKVDPASQFYHCFGCGEGGDVFKFVMKLENVEFPDAIRSLAQRKNIELVEERGEAPRGKKARLFAACEETATFYHQQLMRVRTAESDAARAYLKQRDMGGEIPRLWRLGYAPGRGVLVRHLQKKGFTKDELIEANVAYVPEGKRGELRDRFFNRIMFPISDLQGRTIAFGGRILGQGEPKYLNSADTLLFHKRDNLFAIDRAKAAITSSGLALVVEGYTDVIAMHKTGFTQTVATLGTALTPEHLKLLARFTQKVVLLFDGDEAGQRAADKAADLVNVVAASTGGRKADVFVATLPGAMDPADFCASEGQAAMQEVLDAAVPLLRFAIDRRLTAWDLEKPEQRARALDDVVRLLVPVRGSLLAADYSNYLVDVFGVEEDAIETALKNAKPLVVSSALSSVEKTETEPQKALFTPAEKIKDRTTALECELLFLFIEQPEVRERLVEAFGRISWSLSEHEAIAKILVALDTGDEPEVMLSRLTARMPDASSVLSGTRLAGFSGEPPTRLAGMLMFSIREGQLKQTIHNENTRLRRLDREQQSEQWDDLFRHIAELQQELSDLRRKYQTE
ncbi:MAG: DNA primase [Coriobacteriia bacterium]|nr:DNA primase [Coriobacteriia bacterium]